MSPIFIFLLEVETDFLGELVLRSVALNMVLWHFHETSMVEFLTEIPYAILLLVINHPNLNTTSEFEVFRVIDRWLEADLKERSKDCLSLLRCLRIDGLTANDTLKILDSTSVKKNEDGFKYIETVLQIKRLRKTRQGSNSPNSKKQDCDKNEPTCVQETSMQPRRLPIVPCVVGNINPRPGQRVRQRDLIPRLFIYKNKEIHPHICLKKVQISNSGLNEKSAIDLTQRLKASLNSQGFQVISNGTIFYVTGGEGNGNNLYGSFLGKSNWNKCVWKYDTITSKWEVVCELDNVR